MWIESRSALVGLALAATLVAAGCRTEKSPSTTPADKKAGTPPTLQQVDRLGAYSAGAPRSMLSSPTSPLVLVGLVGSPIDPDWIGSTEPRNDEGVIIPSALVVNDSETGHTRILVAADGVPTMEYVDQYRSWGTAAVPFFDLAWIERDKTFASASWAYVVKGTIGADAQLTFEKTSLRAPGATHDAFISNVEMSGELLFVGTDQGLAVLNPADLSVVRWVSFGGRAVQIMSLSAATMSGSVVAMTLSTGDQAPNAVAIVGADETAAHIFDLDPKEIANAVFGMQDAVLVGVTQADTRGAIRAIRLTGSGYELMPALSADELSTSSFGAVNPAAFAYDGGRNLLLVGGRLRKGGGGAGFVEVPVSPDGYFLGTAQDVTDRRDPYHQILPLQPDLLHVDALGRWFAAGRSLCSESKYRTVGLYRIDQNAGELRLLRPWLSGVRTISVDPEGQTWLGLRDDVPGVSCEGAIVTQSVCRVRADGSCEIFTPYINANLDAFAPSPGAVRIAFGEAPRQALAIATQRDALFVRKGATSRGFATQFDPGLSLEMTSAAWDGNGDLWIGSSTEWSDDDPSLDNEKVNARGPHGLGWLRFGEDGTLADRRRYVRVASDNLPNSDIAGLPSNQVWDVLPLSGDRHALVALGIERGYRTYDHLLPEPNKRGIRGGLAIVDGDQISAIGAPEGVTFGDVVSLAQSNGLYFALDAEAGLFTVDLESKTARHWATPAWSSPTRATALAVDAAGRVAVATTNGVYVYSTTTGVTQVIGGEVGTAWTVRFMSNGFLYAGTDHGLVRASLDDGAFEAAPGPNATMPRDLWEFDRGCYGEESCACRPEKPCALGLDCSCVGGLDNCSCVRPDPCVANPGSIDCACDDTNACHDGLACACSLGGKCSCQPDTTCEEDCSCTGPGTVDGCPSNAICQDGACVINAPPACAANCACTGPDTRPDGCPIDWECQQGIGGPICAYMGATACEDDCSCSGPDTAGGCPTGLECVNGPFGQVCTESSSVACEDDCSCTGPGTTDGCPTGTSCLSPPRGGPGACR
jgi:hypothetical protein